MKILIFGGSGFVGRYLAENLSNNGYEIIATYNRSIPLIKDNNTISWQNLDLKKGVGRLMDGIDIVINLSAVHSLTNPPPTVSDYLEVNINAVNEICEAAIANGVKKYIHFSSISAVGQYTGEQLGEIIQTTQPDIYGLTKFTGEQIALEYSKKIKTIIFRPPGIVGKDYYLCWLGRVLKSLIKNETIYVFNENGLFNNIIGLEEIFRLILDCAKKDSYNGIYNLGANNPMQIKDVIHQLERLTGSKSKVIYKTNYKTAFKIDNSRLLSVGFNPGDTFQIIERYVKQNLI